MPSIRVLLRYHYFQPVNGRFVFRRATTEGNPTVFSLIYSGMIPTEEHESTEEILERLLLRHGTDLRPHPRDYRPIGAGDLLEITGRGTWQVMPTGFRSMNCVQLPAGVPN